MLFGKASGRTFKRFGTTIRFRNRNPLKVKSSDTHPFLIKSPSEALERSILMATFCNRRVNTMSIMDALAKQEKGSQTRFLKAWRVNESLVLKRLITAMKPLTLFQMPVSRSMDFVPFSMMQTLAKTSCC